MKARYLVILALCFSKMVIAQVSINPSFKPAPEVTFDRVEEIFGHNLDTNDTTLKSLLLAIGMDHTSVGSPNLKQRVGIPFIVDAGPNYWVERLRSGDRSIDVLVNNALLILFSKDDITNRRELALKLMHVAANQGYWPADFYIADLTLMTQLIRDFSAGDRASHITKELKQLSEETMERFNRCADIGFAPCQFRIGFWLASSPQTRADGLNVLQKAVETTLGDSRYAGTLDGALIMAANEIVMTGDKFGIEQNVRKEYADLITKMLGNAENQNVQHAVD